MQIRHLVIAILAGALSTPSLVAQDVPDVYAHVGGGVGLAILNSSDITDVAATDYGIGLSGSLAGLVRVGFQQVAQVEYRMGRENHPFRLVGLVSGGPQPFGTLDELEMGYDFSEWTAKLNPFFRTPRSFSPFFVFGQSSADYLNDDDEGFEGTGTIIGIEFIRVTRAVSASVGFKRHGLTFTPVSSEIYGVVLDPSAEFAGANWILDATFGFGIGR